MTIAANSLTIALPKGRSVKPVAELFERAGISPRESAGDPSLYDLLTSASRSLVRHAQFRALDLQLLLLKPDDIPTYVEYGTADLGVCGRDVLLEREPNVYQPLDLNVARCRLVVAGLEAAAHFPGRPARTMPRVATKFPKTAAAHFARRGMQVEIVDLHGSVELAPVLGLADCIVDLVETGTTLVENGLEVRDHIASVSSVLIANRPAFKRRSTELRPLLDALRAEIR